MFNMSNDSVSTEKDAFEKRAKMGIPESRVRYSTGIAEWVGKPWIGPANKVENG